MKDNHKKRKLVKDRSFPDAAQIEKHQDFNRIQSSYKLAKQLLLKKIMLWSAAALGTAGLAALFVTQAPVGNTVAAGGTTPAAAKRMACIQPPLPGRQMPFTLYRISAKNGGVIHHPTGSSIIVPANAFLGRNGKTVGDSITIAYREFHTALDIFLSGIPMQYDSAGLVRTFESAGMIEIQAFDHNDTLTLNEQTPIQIDMASSTADPRFNLYELDTLRQNWAYKGKDKVRAFQETATPLLRNVQATAPPASPSITDVIPQLSDPQHYSFKIAYDKTEFPELAAYDNTLFEVTDQNFKPAYYRINWNRISLSGSTEKGLYLVKLKKADTTISVTARPVFDRADYATALATFEARHKTASLQNEQQEAERQQAIGQVNKSLAGYNSNNMLARAFDAAGLGSKRSFSIRAMGVFNCDYPMPPIVQYAYAFKRFTDENKLNNQKEALDYGDIFLVEKGKNAVFRFSKNEPVRCNPNANNLMWTLTTNGNIAFFRIADYKKLINGAENNIAPVPAKNQELALEEIRKFSGSGS